MTYSLKEFQELDSVALAAVDAAVRVAQYKRERHAEIEIKYKKRKGSTFLRTAIRIKELRWIARHRYPNGPSQWDFLIPEGAIGTEMVQAFIAHKRTQPGDAVRNAMEWCKDHAPWFDCDSVDFNSAPVLLKAETLGQRIRLTAIERDNLGITTIAAHDQTPQQRKAAKRERERQSLADKRRSQGVIARSDYEGKAISRAQPWIAEGISKRTWYRRRAVTPQAGPALPSHEPLGTSLSDSIKKDCRRHTCATPKLREKTQ